MTYTYGTNAGPHAVTNADGINYQYDANGNMTNDNNRSITYSSFDKPTLITKGANQVEFTYGANRSRFKRVDTTDGVVTTTLYMGSVEKVINNVDNSYSLKRYVTGNALWITHYDSNDNVTGTERQYLLKDNLGSVDVILNSAGVVNQELSFDAWGQRRGANVSGTINWAQQLGIYLPDFDTSRTTRGFTGHEHVDSMGLIHMNGRIYDAKLGRFLQADPFVDGVTNTQGYNRYSYGHGNPLNGTDPSGYGFFKEVFDDFLGATENNLVNAAVQVAGYYVLGPAWGAFYSATAGYEAGGWNEALRAGAIAGLSAAAFTAIGGAHFGANDSFFRPLVHGITGGIIAELQGGKFGHGFVSAGLTKALNINKIVDIDANLDNVRIAVAAIIGGTISEITGGKFANGAITAAFGQAFNGEKQAASQRELLAQKSPLEEKISEGQSILRKHRAAANNDLNHKYNGQDIGLYVYEVDGNYVLSDVLIVDTASGALLDPKGSMWHGGMYIDLDNVNVAGIAVNSSSGSWKSVEYGPPRGRHNIYSSWSDMIGGGPVDVRINNSRSPWHSTNWRFQNGGCTVSSPSSKVAGGC